MTQTLSSQTRSQSRGDRPRVYNRVRMLRSERHISQKKLAEALGINHRTVGYLEREEYMPSLSLAWRTCDYFGLPLEAIFSREPFTPMSRQLYGPKGGSDE